MRKDGRQSAIPSSGHVLEMAHSHGNDWMRAVAMQRRRLMKPCPEDDACFAHTEFRREIDLHYLLVALRRLLGAARLAYGAGCTELASPIAAFERQLPDLPDLRNFGEHFDDYQAGRGRLSIDPGRLGLRRWYDGPTGGPVFEWVDRVIDVDRALAAAEELYEALREATQPAERTTDKIDRPEV